MSWFIRLPVKEDRAGSIPAPGASRSRKGKPTGDGSRLENGRAMSLGGSTPPPSALECLDASLAERPKAPVFQTGQAGSTPAGCSRGSANGRLSGLEPDHGGSNPPPRIGNDRFEYFPIPDGPGQLLLVVTPRPERGGRWFDSSPRNSRRTPARVRQPAERPGLKPGDCGFESHPGHSVGSSHGSVGNRQTTLVQTERC